MDDARHNFAGEKAERKFKHLLLSWSDDYKLSSKEIYADSGEDEELELELIPIEYSRADKSGTNQEYWAAWKVARTDIKAHKCGEVDIIRKMGKAAALLAAAANTASSETGMKI